jgi:rhomboid-like protein
MHIGLGGELLLTRKFSLALGGGGYLFAAAYTNEDTRRWSERLGAGSWWRKGKAQPTDREITRAKTMEGAKVSPWHPERRGRTDLFSKPRLLSTVWARVATGDL